MSTPAKKFGTREETLAGISLMTKGGITKEQLVVVDGKIKTQKELDQQEIRIARLSEQRKNKDEAPVQAPVVEQDAPDVPHADDSDEGLVKAIPKSAYKLNDLKELMHKYVKDNDKTLPRGTSKWKKGDWLALATELKLI